MPNNAITITGNTGLSTLIANEAIDDYSDLQISDEVKQKLAAIVLNAKAGLVTIAPLICSGPNVCPFYKRCPIYLSEGESGSYPLDKQCLLEASFARDKFLEYIEELSNTYPDIEESPSLRALVSKLVELDVYEYRLSLILAGTTDVKDSTLLKEQSVALTAHDDEVVQLQEHPAWKMKDRITKLRSEILDILILTPKAKSRETARHKKSMSTDYLSRSYELHEKLDSLIERLDS
jgi:hypothetical protein